MDRKELVKGMRDLNSKCPTCGRIKSHHTVAEARTCAQDPKSLYPESVEPEERYKKDLTHKKV